MNVTANPASSRTGARPTAEGMTQVAIMLAIGGAAGAASFTHVHDVAAAHGQAGWLAWADAVVLELMSVASGLELRRRKRAHIPVRFPMIVLVVAMTLSLSAQVVDAEASVIGWVAAAIPALGFLVMVKIALAQAPDQPSPHTVTAAPEAAVREGRADVATDPPHDPRPRTRPVDSAPAISPAASTASPSLPAEAVAPPGVAIPEAELVRSPGMRAASPDDTPVLVELVPAARSAAEALVQQGRRVSRQSLADTLRANGQAVSNARASALLRLLKEEAASSPGDGRRFQPVPRSGRSLWPIPTLTDARPDEGETHLADGRTA